jgi:hypothetical protein
VVVNVAVAVDVFVVVAGVISRPRPRLPPIAPTRYSVRRGKATLSGTFRDVAVLVAGLSNPDEIGERTGQRLGQPVQGGDRREVAAAFEARQVGRSDPDPPSELSLR